MKHAFLLIRDAGKHDLNSMHVSSSSEISSFYVIYRLSAKTMFKISPGLDLKHIAKIFHSCKILDVHFGCV